MLSSRLRDGLVEMGLDVDPAQLALLLQYLELLRKWNKAYNLTAITDAERMVSYHLLDSLAISDAISPRAHCLDVGTGAGLPGLPLAIMHPRSEWLLLDSNGKKTRFVQQVVAQCGLSNVKVVQSRVEDYHAVSTFDVIVSRAYASLQKFVSTVEHLWLPDTRLMSMKTEPGEEELRQIRALSCQLDITPLQVPGVAEKRCLVTIQR